MTENIIDAEIMDAPSLRKRFHLQVRLEETGPKKNDGRRGRILFENYGANIDQVEFFKSRDTLKANKFSGKELHIWVDNQLWQDLEKDPSEDPNYNESSNGSAPELNLPSVTGNADLALSSAYLRKVQDDIIYYKSEFQKEKSYWDSQILRLRTEYDAQIKSNSEKMMQELALLDAIRSKSFNQQFTAADLALKDSPDEDKGNFVDAVVEGIDKITKNETIMGLVGQFLAKKGITP